MSRSLAADGHVVHPDVDADLAAGIGQRLRVDEVGACLELDDLPHRLGVATEPAELIAAWKAEVNCAAFACPVRLGSTE